MNLRISILQDTAGPALRQVMEIPEEREKICGAAGHRLIRDVSRHVNLWGQSHPNKLGGRRTNYWSGIAAKINPNDCLQTTNAGATVTLGGPEMPGLMRAMGDITIVPGTKTPGVKYIPIPARSEAYGMRPREFGGQLMLFWKGKGAIGGLAQATPVERKKNTKKGAKGSTYYRPGLVFYWFAESVTQPQDRSLLPSDEELANSINAGAAEYAGLRFNQIKGGGL
jgi:hypothetical protein